MAILSEESKVRSTKESYSYQLFSGESALNTKSSEFKAIDVEAVNLIVQTGTGVSAGVVTLEGAATSGYTGTWKSIGSITTNAASTCFAKTIDFTDDPACNFPYIRVRISTVLTGGTLDCHLVIRK